MVEKRILQRTGESAADIAAETEPGFAEIAGEMDVAEGAAYTIEELREFLAADSAEDLADPEFKERLREKLWEMVQRRAGRVPPGDH